MVRTFTKVGSAVALVTTLFGVGGCSAEIPDENVGETGDYLLAGKRLAPNDVANLLRRQGLAESAIPRLVCTAKWESSFYERASNRNGNGTLDRGLFQVNSIHVGGTPGCPSTGEALYDSATNAKCAVAIYRAQGINAWYGYRAHRAECDAYRLPSSSGGSSSTGSDTSSEEGDACKSSTLGKRVGEKTCVQAASDEQWYQCVNGGWQRASSTRGPLGVCSASHPL